MLGCRRGDGEAAGLDEPPTHEKQAHERHDGQCEHPSEADRPPQAVYHRGQPGAHPVAGGDEGDGLRPVSRPGLLGGPHLAERVRGAERRAPQGEYDDEPPVPGAGGGGHGERQPERAREEQHLAPAEAVGDPRERQPAQRRQTQHGEPDAELGPRQSRLVRDRGSVHHPAEGLRHVAERGDGSELPES